MKIKKWKTLSTEYLIRRPWLTARRDAVQLPNGTIRPEHYVLEYPAWVNILAIDRQGNYILIEQYRHGLDDVFIELPAGVAEEGEEPLEAAKRELQEETGYGNGEWELLTVLGQNPSTCNNLTYCYLARNVEPISDLQLDEGEDIALHLTTRRELTEMMERDEIKQALMAAPIWKHLLQLHRSTT